MLAVLGNPSQVNDKFSFSFSFGTEGLVFLDGERSEHDVPFFVTSASLDEESTILDSSIDGDFLTLPVVSLSVVKRVQEILSSLIVRNPVDKFSLSLILLFGD